MEYLIEIFNAKTPTQVSKIGFLTCEFVSLGVSYGLFHILHKISSALMVFGFNGLPTEMLGPMNVKNSYQWNNFSFCKGKLLHRVKTQTFFLQVSLLGVYTCL